jgi:hypothetical protein
MNNPESRCFATVTAHRKQTDGNEKEIYQQILADFDILNPNTWRKGDEKDMRYGEGCISSMCSRFRRKTADQF